MKPKMSPLTSIKTDGDKIEIVNQLLLPHTTEYVEIGSIEEAHDAIKSMVGQCSHFSFSRQVTPD